LESAGGQATFCLVKGKEVAVPEPALPAYLSIPDSAKADQRGGTVIHEGVWSFEEHERLVSDPSGYRLDGCVRCGEGWHGHGCRYRRLRDQPDRAETAIRRYICTGCGGVWQVLPAFLARHLHRTWGAVQSRMAQTGVLSRAGPEWRVRSKPTTTWRWRRRLEASAARLTQALGAAGVDLASVVSGSLLATSRAELVEALASAGVVAGRHKTGALAVWVHRLVPGVRLM
jgi:hypothetical protein